MNKSALEQNQAQERATETEKVEISIHLDSDVLDQIKHLSNNPSRVIETALKQWLRGERQLDGELARTFRRNPPVPPRGEWND